MATVEKRGKNWRLVAYLGYDELGRQIKKRKTINGAGVSKAEAVRQANKFESQLIKNGSKSTEQTVNSIIEYWLTHYGENLSPTTVQRNEILLRRIKQAIGHIRAHKLAPRHILLFIDALNKHTNLNDSNKPLSSRTISMHFKLLSAILNKAVKWKLIDENPCLRVDPPKETTKPQPILQEGDLAKFLNLLMTEAPLKYKAFFLLAFTDGLRRSEICGLDESNIDFENGTLKINQTAVTVGNTIVIKPGGKTQASIITMAIAPITLQAIQDYINERQKIETALGYSHSTLIFSNPDGSPIAMKNYLQWLHRFLSRHGLPKVNVQGFRKMAITYAMQKVNLKEASQFGRHSNISTTAKYYAEVLQSQMATPTNYLNDLVENAVQSKGNNI
ncbi:site-specific integrase [Veillonella sp.]|uniref:tyrosine-type recombinase/integrase n=1 Tax=Veillonella sp. TaxID=1926307 RepID=UPI0025F31636|nr:site-specific integrase [Veillonella sp.]